jgi:1,4-alpha-glucan branching enzyme
MPVPMPPHAAPEKGANVVADRSGVAFACWAPRAKNVWISGSFNGWAQKPETLLNRRGDDWIGFVPGAGENVTYKFFVEGEGTSGYKRDPYARELTYSPGYPYNDCIVRDPRSYPWHDTGYHPPRFNEFLIYQLHVGVFYGLDRGRRPAKFLDVLKKLDYFVALGVNALQLLPVVEFANMRSLGYEGADIFSPEMDYGIADEAELAGYLQLVNALLARKGRAPLGIADLQPQSHQLKALIDVCHVYDIAVLFDVVYNHAGDQIKGQWESIYFFDRAVGTNPNDSLYFTNRTHAGGPVWAIWKAEVRQFLIDNAVRFLREYRIDGLRFDQVSVVVDENRSNGWDFCRDLTDAARRENSAAIQIAEFWSVEPAVVRSRANGGAGFDACWVDHLRKSIRAAIAAAAAGPQAHVDMDAIAASLWPPHFLEGWRAVQYVESHDEVYRNRNPRIAALGDPGSARSWWSMSRARVATGLLLAAPGIPMLFMGQEFLEDKRWSDNPANDPGLLLWWDGLDGGIDRQMTYHLQFVQAACRVRREQPALRGERLNVVHVHNDNRVLAFHRWIEGEGRDVMVIVSLNERAQYGYEIGFPAAGPWREILNSEYHNVNNGGQIDAFWQPLHRMPATARMVLPANSILIFAR